VLGVALLVAEASMLSDEQRMEGRLREASAAMPAGIVQPGEWQAYHCTGPGQRFSPLDQTAPSYAGALQQAWRYLTDGVR
jgi:glucose dehydrogenase